jgi:hypothetical protein
MFNGSAAARKSGEPAKNKILRSHVPLLLNFPSHEVDTNLDPDPARSPG